MISSSGERRSNSSSRPAAFALAATAGLLLCLALAGCSPEPTEQGAPITPGEEPPSPSDTAVPSTPEGEGPTSEEGSPTGVPADDEETPDDAGTPAEDDDGAEDEPDQGVNATDDWQEPDDPAAEGPTAAPALSEVNGRIDEDVALPTEVVVSLTSITTTTLTAETPGEYTGPAVVVGVRITNESDAPQPVGSAVVSLAAEDGEMGVPTWASPNVPLQGEVPAGATAEGTYVFMLDPADERAVSVRVNYSAGEPVATFTGTTP